MQEPGKRARLLLLLAFAAGATGQDPPTTEAPTTRRSDAPEIAAPPLLSLDSRVVPLVLSPGERSLESWLRWPEFCDDSPEFFELSPEVRELSPEPFEPSDESLDRESDPLLPSPANARPTGAPIKAALRM